MKNIKYKNKLYLGCGPSPIHPQHLEIMGDTKEWSLIDLYVSEQNILNWDARTLKEVKDESVKTIYASHLLEHFPYVDMERILKRWYDVLKSNGKLIINVPDLSWAARQLIKLESGQVLFGEYNQLEGERGLLAIIYGAESHEGEYHKAGFTKQYLEDLLKRVGFKQITINQVFEAHDMMCLIAEAIK